MRTKAPHPGRTLAVPGDDLTATLVGVALDALQLKHLFRQGWLKRGVPEARCETVAEHGFLVAFLALLLAEHLRPGLDLARVVQMALIHDLGEVDAGDITPADGVSAEAKSRLERAGVVRLLAGLPHGERYLALWEEFEAQATPEARFVRQVDRLEMALQAAVYHGQLGLDVEDFFETAARSVGKGPLRGFLDRLRRVAPTADP